MVTQHGNSLDSPQVTGLNVLDMSGGVLHIRSFVDDITDEKSHSTSTPGLKPRRTIPGFVAEALEFPRYSVRYLLHYGCSAQTQARECPRNDPVRSLFP